MELSTEHQQKRRPSDSNTDYITHKDNGRESDPEAGHKNVRDPSDPRPSRRTLRGDVSRQILADLRSGRSRGFSSADVQRWFGCTAPSFPCSNFIAPVLGTIVFLYGGLVFLRTAWSEIVDHKPGMMTLISLGITVAFATPLAGTFGLLASEVWRGLATLTTIMILGRWLEMRTVSQARGALNALAALLPDGRARCGPTEGLVLLPVPDSSRPVILDCDFLYCRFPRRISVSRQGPLFAWLEDMERRGRSTGSMAGERT